jgi:MoaA/NifB/PqqE/SkfB family radical SAM enzyme
MVKVFVGDSYRPHKEDNLNDVKRAYKEKYGEYPPKFVVLSPGKACNLECVGCYASCIPGKGPQLDFATSRKIVREAHDIFGDRFMILSGGEPLIYHNQGKTILDICEEFNDMFFLMYTNGTLITKEIAERIAGLGNVTLAISVEGYEFETDERRGAGVHKKIREGMKNLREAGVPFGVSITATAKNYEVLLTDDLYKYYFEEMGATFMFQFQLMPIGRGKEVMELMITPEQRMELYKKWEYVSRKLEYPFADFWNSASLSSGCISFGRWNGYFYVDFDGKVMPCVFVPYYVEKIQDVYAKGGTLADAIQTDLFKNGRRWQKDCGLDKCNLLTPCPFRDHYEEFRENILTQDSKGEDRGADESLDDEEFHKIMADYGRELKEISKEIYDKKFRKSDLPVESL